MAAQLKLLDPNLELFGLGGDRMSLCGMELRYHTSQLSFLGFWEVIKHIPFIREVEKDLLEQVHRRKPSLAILIDYPGFNLRLAARLKALDVPVMYYVSPQVWAWGRKRIRKIKHLVNKMVVVFEFEKKMYEAEGMAAEWYGHPLLDIVKPKHERTAFLNKMGLDGNDRYIGLFPGSRKQEIERILPAMRDAVIEVARRDYNCRGIIGCAPGIDDSLYRQIGGESLLYSRGNTYDLMAHSELNLVASGTATLECGILSKPLFILYKTSPVTYQIARRLIKIPFVGLVNVVAGEKIVPEFIQHDCRGSVIAREMKRYFASADFKTSMTSKLAMVKGKLGQPGASRHVAQSALQMLSVKGN